MRNFDEESYYGFGSGSGFDIDLLGIEAPEEYGDEIEKDEIEAGIEIEETEIEEQTEETARKYIRLRWYPGKVGFPAVLSRSALFTTRRQGKRAFLNRKTVFSTKDAEIIYSGEELTQGDKRVFQAVLTLCYYRRGRTEFQFPIKDALKLLGLQEGNLNAQVFVAALQRLVSGVVDVSYSWTTKTHQPKTYYFVGHLVNSFSFVENGKKKATISDIKASSTLFVSLAPEIQTLFLPGRFNSEDWEVLRRLRSNFLAQWLYSFANSTMFPASSTRTAGGKKEFFTKYSYPFLSSLCGSQIAEQKVFKTRVAMSVDEINAALKASHSSWMFQLSNFKKGAGVADLTLVKKRGGKDAEEREEKEKPSLVEGEVAAEGQGEGRSYCAAEEEEAQKRRQRNQKRRLARAEKKGESISTCDFGEGDAPENDPVIPF